jgi:hypothetical protein
MWVLIHLIDPRTLTEGRACLVNGHFVSVLFPLDKQNLSKKKLTQIQHLFRRFYHSAPNLRIPISWSFPIAFAFFIAQLDSTIGQTPPIGNFIMNAAEHDPTRWTGMAGGTESDRLRADWKCRKSNEPV